jgi:hypothetical protein
MKYCVARLCMWLRIGIVGFLLDGSSRWNMRPIRKMLWNASIKCQKQGTRYVCKVGSGPLDATSVLTGIPVTFSC